MTCPICRAASGCDHERRPDGSVTIPTRSYREEPPGVVVAENALVGEGPRQRDIFFYKEDLESQRTDAAGITWLTLKAGASFFVAPRLQ